MRFETSVKQIIPRTKDVMSFRFSKPAGFDFAAGQYMSIALKIGEVHSSKVFSISSSPTELGYLEITKKLTGHEFSNALVALKEGDKVSIGGPYGELTFKGEYDKIALTSSGIGITPLRSIIRYSTDKQLKTKITLLYSNESEEDVVFKDELEEMQRQNNNLQVVNTIMRPSEKWNGLTGPVNKEMIQKEISDYVERVFYLSGPQKIVAGIVAILRRELNIPRKQIKEEYFAGF